MFDTDKRSSLSLHCTNEKIIYKHHCGLYYKHITIVDYNSSIVNKLGPSLTHDARVVIYNHHVFIVHATDGRKS